MNTFKLIGSGLSAFVLFVGLQATQGHAASVCKGLEKSQCESLVFEGINVCRWQGEYYTTRGPAGNYCTTSGKKVQNREQYERMKAAVEAQLAGNNSAPQQ